MHISSALRPEHKTFLFACEVAASAAGIKVVAASSSSKAEIAPAFQKLSQAGAQAVIVPRDGLFLAESERIAELARAARLPTAHSLREGTEAGGLISYGVNVPANFRRAAYFVDKILKGAKPADLPIEFPTRLELVINLKTAKALGLEVPPCCSPAPTRSSSEPPESSPSLAVRRDGRSRRAASRISCG